MNKQSPNYNKLRSKNNKFRLKKSDIQKKSKGIRIRNGSKAN